jgi:hypothetical protein
MTDETMASGATTMQVVLVITWQAGYTKRLDNRQAVNYTCMFVWGPTGRWAYLADGGALLLPCLLILEGSRLLVAQHLLACLLHTCSRGRHSSRRIKIGDGRLSLLHASCLA